MWVVKLGGSLAQSPRLPLWLEALSQTGAVVVPGGGPFADAVRRAQARWRFGDTAAHAMAILAMNQYGRMLAGLCPALRTASGLEELQAPDGRAAIWLPTPEPLDAAGVPATWDVTSDSLAAWLAGRVGAGNLLLVKSALPPAPAEAAALDPAELVNQGWVDPVFPSYAARGPFQSWLCGPDGHVDLAAALAEPAKHFARIAG